MEEQCCHASAMSSNFIGARRREVLGKGEVRRRKVSAGSLSNPTLEGVARSLKIRESGGGSDEGKNHWTSLLS